MKIAIGSDHAGFEYKESIKKMLELDGYIVTDCGTYSADRVDYPDYSVKVAALISSKEVDFGVLICGSGIGVAITANKVKGVRAATCITTEMAKLARAHNDANIVCLGERLLSIFEAREIVHAFLHGKFEGGRHATRVQKIHDLTGK